MLLLHTSTQTQHPLMNGPSWSFEVSQTSLDTDDPIMVPKSAGFAGSAFRFLGVELSQA